MHFASSLLAVWLLHMILVQGAANSEVVCGQPVVSPRIVGGQAAADGSWPWHVTILQNVYFVCGGSLIAKQWVLSAAHCVFGHTTSPFFVLLGTYRLFNLTPNVTISRVQKIILHPDYNGKIGSIGDIALLKLQTPVEFTDYILPACLPGFSVQFPPDADCWVTGWGTTKGGVQLYPQVLQEVKVPLINQETCNNLFNSAPLKGMDKDPIKADMICAGYPEGEKDSCKGDSGGPLVCKLEDVWTQAGIVSWGAGCAQPNYPGVYTSVSYYIIWINETMAGSGGGQNGRENGSDGQNGGEDGQAGGQNGDGDGQAGGQSGNGDGQSGGQNGDGDGQASGQSGNGAGQSGGQNGDGSGQSAQQNTNGGGQSGGQNDNGGGGNGGLHTSPTLTLFLVSLALALHFSAFSL